MPDSNSSKKKSGVCPKCKQKFSFDLKPGLASVECPHCQAKIKLKPKAQKKPQSNEITQPPAAAKKKSAAFPPNLPHLDSVGDAPTNSDNGDAAIAEQLDAIAQPPQIDSLPTASPPPVASLPTIKLAKDLATDDQEIPPEAIAQLVPEKDLLPPKFIVDQASANVIILPSADGGTQVIDPNVVHVKHGNQTISLTALTPAQRARRQVIQNSVILLLAALMLAAAIWILL